MGKVTGFKEFKRSLPEREDAAARIQHFNEFDRGESDEHIQKQSARCMDCGVPFCHNGCPLGNVIPDFNDAVYKEDWKQAYEILDSTNNFPEFTGRICPAPCEGSCVLGINNDPVAIEYIEKSIIEKAFEQGWVKAYQKQATRDEKIAIVGSGPAGLAAADQLIKLGYQVTVFEKNTRIGGLLRYGIPDFKLEKSIVDRRVALLEASGVTFKSNTEIGVDIQVDTLKAEFDSIILCCGSTIPRDLNIEGRSLKGVHFAMDYLEQNNKIQAGDTFPEEQVISPKGEDVVVIGGGDTGSDCIGTSNRLGATSILQIEILGKPSNRRSHKDAWPLWPMTLKTSSSHEEGCDREWAVMTKRFISEDGNYLSGIELCDIEWKEDQNGKFVMQELPDTTRVIPCQKVFLAMGFLHPQQDLIHSFGLKVDDRKNIYAQNYQTSDPQIFAAGDARRGQSLVVWAIAEGREVAAAVHAKYSDVVPSKVKFEQNLLAV